jgi:hypothetical protein
LQQYSSHLVHLTATIVISVGTIEQKNGKIDRMEVWPEEIPLFKAGMHQNALARA